MAVAFWNFGVVSRQMDGLFQNANHSEHGLLASSRSFFPRTRIDSGHIDVLFQDPMERDHGPLLASSFCLLDI
jgi:hypothetical protein